MRRRNENAYMAGTIMGALVWSKWQGAGIALAVLVVPKAGTKSKRGGRKKDDVMHGIPGAHMWAKWLRNPCRLGGHQRTKKTKWLQNPCPLLST